LRDKRRLIITDIDFELYEDATALLDWSENHDVVLRVSRSPFVSCFPWLKVTAGAVCVNDSAMGQRFLDMYSECFRRSYVPSGFNWGVDQNILCALNDEFSVHGFIGNLMDIRSPFRVPYKLKRGE
jgi:hypothetical protein